MTKNQLKGRKQVFSEDVELKLEDIEECIRGLQNTTNTPDTILTYERALRRLWSFLPEDERLPENSKVLSEALLHSWIEHLLKEFSVASVNLHISAVNVFVDFIGHRELTIRRFKVRSELDRAQLTRGEYIRALQQARKYKDAKSYFAIKLYGDTGIRPKDITNISVDDVLKGEFVCVNNSGVEKKTRIPECLHKELLAYLESEGLTSGPFFRQLRTPAQATRTEINIAISKVFEDAALPMEKANPACLRDLYNRTHREIEANISRLIEQAYDQFLDMEQAAVGWEIK